MANDKRGAPTSVRLAPELKKWLKHKAVDNYRSFGAEIVARLEKSQKAEEAAHEIRLMSTLSSSSNQHSQESAE